MKERKYQVTLRDFARSFGTTVEDLPKDCREFIAKKDFRYQRLTEEERNEVIMSVLKKIESDQQNISSPERQAIWEKGWNKNLREFIKSGRDLNKLVPKFFRPNQVIRFKQNYIMPSSHNFELDYFSVFRLWFFMKYLKDFDSIYEFGCGTGFNLAVLAQLYPKKQLHGLDFVPSSVALVDKLGEAYGWNIKGHHFNMFSPDESIKMGNNDVVFTIAAIEQLASNFEPFLQFILKRSCGLCLHVEPLIELYDENNLIDYLAVKFHNKRGYTKNFLTRLKELEAQNRVKILKIKRLFFGSLYHEAYSYIIWKPTKPKE